MSVSSQHRLDKVVWPSTVEFSQLRNTSYDANIESLLEAPAGHPFDMFGADMSQKPKINFETNDLATLLANVGVNGLALGASTYFFKLSTAVGTVARATTSHSKIVVASSLAYFSQIRLPHNGPGTAQVTVCAVYDGSNEPFVASGSQALSGNITATSYHGAGPLSLNGTAVTGIQEITIENQVTLQEAGSDSELYDTFIGVEKVRTAVVIKTFSLVNWGAVLGLNGLALNGSTGLTLFMRKFAAGGTRVANGTAQHIKAVGAAGRAIPVNTQGSDSGPVSDTCRVELIAGSDSVLPLIFTTGQAIS